MTKLTTAFLGVAHIHTPSFIDRLNKRSDDVTAKYVYDIDAERGALRAAQMPGCSFVSDPAVILDDESVGSVVVCSETDHHLDLVVKAAKAGKDIFCEKPLGLTSGDCAAMASAIKEAGVTFQTGFFLRSSPVHQFIKREVLAGHLGNITRIRYTNCHQAALAGWFDTEWRWLTDTKLAGGGALLDLGAHPLDIIIDTYLTTEGDIVNISGAVGNRGGRYGDKIDEYGTALLTFTSGATAVIEASWVDSVLRSPIEVNGTEGQIQVVGDQVAYYSKHIDGADGKSPVENLPAAAPHAFELFWDSLLGMTLQVPLITVEQATLGSTIMEKIYAAAGR
jgi:1,5-anhydro-D-fructose reductase (1,5-anhydro-D-mannitol-forming)